MSTEDHGRDASLETIQRELTEFARRSRATATRIHPELPLVSYTLLAHVDARGGCSATELAAHYLLDKSTVSRQVSALERLGLVERRPDPADQRVQVVHCTEAGEEAVVRARESRREAIRARLTDWDTEDLATFAALLRRYNTAPATPPARRPGPAERPAPGSRSPASPESG
ncbi:MULTISPECIES: MarR family winged helix-turn-helix transcriptional regulator [Streptomyces]|uniref:Winged helix-turn-helix transcriptional regulator n=1 Tax=Streptomyces lycii TaxID=2654337 RepID=A0ABQ7FJX7_9ACTN|nr:MULTISPECIES: MarR family winged helix-turn-helix transcriptional regulator [Streptomyces]KAF4408283.1 winged helix-turn-helix transcriptional regulator [Streptomyces lycii]PGH47554.1 MarR family transcriptional regulator [Streptomyces sp. Ru87]